VYAVHPDEIEWRFLSLKTVKGLSGSHLPLVKLGMQGGNLDEVWVNSLNVKTVMRLLLVSAAEIVTVNKIKKLAL
jgi:hypothetical protein